jgi:hypothetical protein
VDRNSRQIAMTVHLPDMEIGQECRLAPIVLLDTLQIRLAPGNVNHAPQQNISRLQERHHVSIVQTTPTMLMLEPQVQSIVQPVQLEKLNSTHLHHVYLAHKDLTQVDPFAFPALQEHMAQERSLYVRIALLQLIPKQTRQLPANLVLLENGVTLLLLTPLEHAFHAQLENILHLLEVNKKNFVSPVQKTIGVLLKVPPLY